MLNSFIKRNYKIILAIAATLIHMIIAIIMEDSKNISLSIILSFSVFIPVIIFGMLYGIRGGIIASILIMIFNYVLDIYFSPPLFAKNLLFAWYGAYLVTGIIVGHISKLNAKLTKTLKQREVIIKESNHRISNSLSLIINLIRLQARSIDSKDENAKNLFYDLEKRIESIGLIHKQLFKSESFEKIDFYNYITSLSDSIVSSFIEDKERIKVFVNIIKVELEPDILLPIGLIVTEVITNAIKYGFPNNKKGDIKIMLAKKKSNFTLELSNNGELLPNNFDINNTNTLGMRLTKSLVKQLDGELEVTNEKEVKFKITFTV